MAVNWSTVKAAAIPEGNVEKVAINGTTVWKYGGLPSIYQAVEYIGCTGTQYLETGYIPTPSYDTRIDMQYMFTATQIGVDKMLFGSRGGKNDITYQCQAFGGSQWYCGGGYYQFRSVLKNVGTALNTKYTFLINGNTMTINGSSVSQNQTRTTGSALELYIFAWNSNGETKYINSGVRIYQLKFTVNGIVEADFVPCYRKSDNVAGMYDLIGRRFLTNAGTGTFSAGQDINLTS